MTYELTKLKNAAYLCPRCGGRTVKYGKHKGFPRRRCNDCDYYYDVKPENSLST